MKFIAFLTAAVALALLPAVCPQQARADAGKRISIASSHIVLAPYVWKSVPGGAQPSVEATMPGAYLRAAFHGSASISLVIDGAANAGCPDASMPVVEYSIDNRPYQVVQLSNNSGVYTLPLGTGLDPAPSVSHTAALFFRAADLEQNRWRASTAHLRVVGLDLDPGGALTQTPILPKRVIAYGDSITEGVGVDALFTSWESLGPNNARASWLPDVCNGLDAEYGQLGSGGQGMLQQIEMPPLPQTWDKYDVSASRLTGGKLLPEPDCVFCLMGTNDRNLDANGRLGALFQPNLPDISKAYAGWLSAMRAAAPHARIFCIIAPLGFHGSEIGAVVADQRKSGDKHVYLIDTSAKLRDDFGFGPSRLAYDGVHPNVYGNAVLAGIILAQVEQDMKDR